MRRKTPSIAPPPQFDCAPLHILGYVSGVGFVSSLAAQQDMLKPYDRSDVIGYVRSYCRSNVSKTLLNATNDFIYSLTKASR